MAYSFEDIKDASVVITGSGRGIGKGIAELFIEHGAKVVITDIDADVVKSTTEELSKKGEAIGIVCDVTNEEQVNKLIDETVEKFEGIDVLVNNAGITKDGLFLRMKLEQFQIVNKINLEGTFLCTKAAVNKMRKAKKGSIINISSIARMGSPGQTNYSASKAAVVGFTRSLAKEIAGYGIRVNCVAPGFVETRLTDAIPDKIRDGMIDSIPLKRTGQPLDIANPILFLASEMSAYITGQTLDVNGGLA